MTTASTLGGQLRLNVHPADGALLVGDEPLVHAQLVEEVHTRETSGEDTDETLSPGHRARLMGLTLLVSTVGANPRRIYATFTASLRL